MLPLTFEGGLDIYTDAAKVPNGRASRLENWVAEQDGSLRVRTGWDLSVTTGMPSGATKGGFWNPSTPTGWYVYKSGDGLYRLETPSRPTSGTWSEIDTTAVGTGDPLAFVAGAGFVVYGNGDFPLDRLRKYNGAASSDAGTAAVAGKALAWFKDRFWSGGTDANPEILYYSAINDPNTWDLTNQTISVGEKPQAIVCLQPFLDGLLIVKENAVWFLTGDGPSSFSLHRLDSGDGPAVGSRCVAVAPVGAVIASSSDVWLWPGGGPVLAIGRSILGDSSNPPGAYYEGSAQHAAWHEGKMYVCSQDPNGGTLGGNMWSWDPAGSRWTAEQTGDGAESVTQIFPAGPGGAFLAGLPNAGVVNVGVLYRDRDRFRDDGIAERFRAKTGILSLGGVAAPATLLHLHLLVRQRSGDADDAALSVTPIIDAVSQTVQMIAPKASAGVFRTRLDWGYTGFTAQVELDHNVPSTDTALFDILEAVLEYEVEEPR